MNKPKTISGRPPAFLYSSSNHGRELCCEQVPLSRLAERFGTPLYVYSANTLRTRFAEYERAFAHQPHTVCYSVKANSNLSLLRMLAAEGAGFDVVSGGELERVLRVSKQAAKRVVFSGVGKTAAELDLALRADVLLFNLESEAELELLASRASTLRKTARIAFRVNPDVKAETHPYISTGLREHKFGVPISRARELYELAASFDCLEPAGVSAHIGSQITDMKPFAETVQRLVALVRELLADGLNIRFLDAGGGLGINYHGSTMADFRRSVRAYAEAISKPLKGSDLHLLLEPGRSIVAPAGALITRALYAKQNCEKQFLIVDAAMNDLIRPSLYGARHEIVAVTPRKPQSAPNGSIGGSMDVVGPICETGDFLGRDRHLDCVAPGDLLAVLDAGAYGMSLSSNYNSRPRPAEVLVDGTRTRLIRRRETMDDLLRTES
ncbi:MAG TPA: diaminopimelate decarboxylase [Candidatus Acidoferrales bacterium]|nr:diaminopimelate decarboxylase [Candidatus Acidoferrales bacterium]